jgi:uncharacterized protein DUF4232
MGFRLALGVDVTHPADASRQNARPMARAATPESLRPVLFGSPVTRRGAGPYQLLMARLGLVMVALIIAAAACGPFHQLAASSTPAGTIPWLPLSADLTPLPQPSPQAQPVPPGTPACMAGQVAGAVLGSQGATGNVITYLAFAGTGQSACFVEGTPAVTAFDAAGHTIPFKERAPYFPPQVSGPQLVSPGPVPAPNSALKYGQAGFDIDWVSQPEACPGQGGVTVAQVRVAIPGGGALSLALPATPQAYVCQGLGVGSFESPPLVSAAAPQPPLPAIQLGIQGAANPGKNFEYLVTLTNDTKQPIDLALTCPNYEEELFADILHASPPLGGKHLYKLNCAPVGTLAPGGRAIFQMIFAVPADANPGTYTLLFRLGFSNGMGNAVERPLELKAA